MKNLLVFLFMVFSFFAHSQSVELFGKLYNIHDTTVLSLSSDAITCWPPQLFMLVNLKKIEIASKNLFEIDPKIADLPKLEVLDLSGAELEYIPESLAQLSQLKEIRLNLKNLHLLPANFKKLSRLRQLHLCGQNTKLIGHLGSHSTNPEIMHLKEVFPTVVEDLFINGKHISSKNIPHLFSPAINPYHVY